MFFFLAISRTATKKGEEEREVEVEVGKEGAACARFAVFLGRAGGGMQG